MCIACNEKITILLDVNGENKECDFHNMRQFLSKYIKKITLSKEKIFDMYSSVGHLWLNSSIVEIKVKLLMYIGVFTHRSLL